MSRENFLLKCHTPKNEVVYFVVSNITRIEATPKTDKSDAFTTVYSVGSEKGTIIREVAEEIIKKAKGSAVLQEII